MSKIIILRGLPSSGKSTWALEFIKNNKSFVRINRDSIREQLGREYSKDFERTVRSIRDASIVSALTNGFSVIVDDVNLDISNIEQITSLRDSIDSSISIEIREFTVPLEECLVRNERRINKVPAKVIVDMWEKYLRKDTASLHPTYYPDNSHLKDAIVCDLDGTLALKHPDRHIYDYNKVFMDLVHEPVADLLFHMIETNKDVEFLFCSGREDSCREQTEQWIKEKLLLPEVKLFMRKTGDHRGDDIVKVELWEEHIKDKYNVWFWLDDRQRVVDAMRKVGIPVWQVAPGDF